MNAIPFDTLKFARALRDKAKLPLEQAEGFADVIAEAVQGDLATRADLLGVSQAIRTNFGRWNYASKASSTERSSR